jgi:hypothetical protein
MFDSNPGLIPLTEPIKTEFGSSAYDLLQMG